MGSHLGNEFPDGNLLSDVLLWTICASDIPADFPSWREERIIKDVIYIEEKMRMLSQASFFDEKSILWYKQRNIERKYFIIRLSKR